MCRRCALTQRGRCSVRWAQRAAYSGRRQVVNDGIVSNNHLSTIASIVALNGVVVVRSGGDSGDGGETAGNAHIIVLCTALSGMTLPAAARVHNVCVRGSCGCADRERGGDVRRRSERGRLPSCAPCG